MKEVIANLDKTRTHDFVVAGQAFFSVTDFKNGD